MFISFHLEIALDLTLIQWQWDSGTQKFFENPLNSQVFLSYFVLQLVVPIERIDFVLFERNGEKFKLEISPGSPLLNGV